MPIQHTSLCLTPTPSKRVQRLCLAGCCLDMILLFQTGLNWIWQLGYWGCLGIALIHLLKAQQILQFVPLEDGRWRVVDQHAAQEIVKLKEHRVFCPMMIRLDFEVLMKKSGPCNLDPVSEAGEEKKEAGMTKVESGRRINATERKINGGLMEKIYRGKRSEANKKRRTVRITLFPDSLPIRDYKWLLLWLKFQDHSQPDGPQCWSVWQALRAKYLSRYRANLSRAPDLS